MATKLTRRLFIRWSGLIVGGMSLAQACAPGPASSPVTSTAKPSEAPKPADAAKPAQAAKPAATAPATKQPVTITYLDFVTPGDNTPRGQALANRIKAFEAANPDVKVTVETLPPNQIHPQLIQGAASKKTPDVIKIFSFELGMHVAAESIEALDPYVADWDKSDWLVDWDQTVYAGKKMAVPHDHRILLLQYRTSLLDAKGVAVPTTWDEVLAGGKKIGPENPMGIAIGLSKTGGAYSLTEYFVAAVAGAGGKLFNDDGTAAFNGEAGVRAFKLIDDFYKEKASSQAAVNFNYDSVQDGLKSGTLAMGIIGSHRISVIRAGGAGQDLDYRIVPSWETGKPGPGIATTQHLTLGKYAPNKEAAMKYIDFMTGPRAAVELAKGGEIPPRKSSYKDPFFSTPASGESARIKQLLETHPGPGQYPEKWAQVMDMLADAAQEMVLQNRAPKDVLDATAQKYNALVGK